MEDIKELFKELTEELEKDCSGWDVAPDTEADKTFKEKYGTEWRAETPRNPPKMTIQRFFAYFRGIDRLGIYLIKLGRFNYF